VDYASFLRAAERGQTPPATLLHGPEPFLLDEAVVRLTRGICPDPARVPLAREILEAREAGAEAIVRSALVLSWDGGRRLVVVKGVEGLPARQGEPLAEYLQAPNPACALVLLAGQRLEGAHWLLKAMPPAGVVAVPQPSGGALVRWLHGRAASEGLELEEEAALALVELLGEDPAALAGELEKAALTGGADNRRITVREVRAVVGEHRLRHIFELTGALDARDAGAALRVLDTLLNAGEEPLVVAAMLAREVRMAWQVAEWLALGREADAVVPRLRRPPAAARALIDYARRLTPAAAARLLERCWEAERRMKLGGPPRAELALLVADLCAV
jgi:DNA polymerase III subunit delta